MNCDYDLKIRHPVLGGYWDGVSGESLKIAFVKSLIQKKS